MHYLYLIIILATIFFPFVYSFESKISFYKQWKYLLPAIILAAIPFLIWDHFYTIWQIWGFNDRYITGLNVASLPIEEILFFFTIPYACMFIYEYLNRTLASTQTNFFDRYQTTISISTIALCIILLIFNFNGVYTRPICIILILLLILKTFIFKVPYMGKYWRFMTVMLIPFLIINGVLTGTGIPESVFWYRKDSITNLLLGTIPVEDLLYAWVLMLTNVSFYEWLKKDGENTDNQAEIH